MTKQTYGQKINNHIQEGHQLEDAVHEYGKPMGRDVMKLINEEAYRSSKLDQYANKDFYVCCAFKIQKVGQAIQPITYTRYSCPTPVYNLAVWKYHHLSQDLEYLFSIPSEWRYLDIISNSSDYLQDKEWKTTTNFVLLMESGQLLDWVKKENGELKDAVIKIDKEVKEK